MIVIGESGPNTGDLLVDGFQEGCFWMQRVGAINLSVNVSDGSESIMHSDIYPVLQSGLPSNEFDHLFLRGGVFAEYSEVGPPLKSVDYEFATRLVKDDTVESPAFGWYIRSFLSIFLGTTFSTSPTAGVETPMAAKLTLSATYPDGIPGLSGTVFSTQQTIYGGASDTLTGDVIITPASYFPWTSKLGVQTYDTSTGAKIA